MAPAQVAVAGADVVDDDDGELPARPDVEQGLPEAVGLVWGDGAVRVAPVVRAKERLDDEPLGRPVEEREDVEPAVHQDLDVGVTGADRPDDRGYPGGVSGAICVLGDEAVAVDRVEEEPAVALRVERLDDALEEKVAPDGASRVDDVAAPPRVVSEDQGSGHVLAPGAARVDLADAYIREGLRARARRRTREVVCLDDDAIEVSEELVRDAGPVIKCRRHVRRIGRCGPAGGGEDCGGGKRAEPKSAEDGGRRTTEG